MIRWIWDWAKYHNSHSSKSIRVTKLSFCQSDSPMSESFWQKNSLVSHIIFDLCLSKHFCQVTNFCYQSLIFGLSASSKTISIWKHVGCNKMPYPLQILLRYFNFICGFYPNLWLIWSSRLVLCLKCMEQAWQFFHGHF